MSADSRQQFKLSIPLFQDLPDRIYQTLDLSHFILPNSEITALVSKLAKLLDAYVVPYHAQVFRLDIPIETHLCALVKGAQLTPPQLALLKKYEQQLSPQNITLVIFAKPIQLLKIEESAMYQKYAELKLL